VHKLYGCRKRTICKRRRFFTSVFYLGRKDNKWGLSHGSIEENMKAIYSHSWDYTTDWNYIMAVIDKIQSKFYSVDILWCNICRIEGIKGKTTTPHIACASDDKRDSVITAINMFLDYYNEINNIII